MRKKILLNRSNINFIIDALLLLIMSAIIGIGFMIKLVLLTGQQKWGKFGANVDQTILGLDRHGWGSVHLYLGFIFIGLLVLHIIVHWKMIGCMYRRLINNFKVRKAVAIPFLFACFVLLVIPFWLKLEMIELQQGEGRIGRNNQAQQTTFDKSQLGREPNIETASISEQKVVTNSDNEDISQAVESTLDYQYHNHRERKLEIRVYMTIAQLCQTYNVPLNYLKDKLSLPDHVSEDMRLSIQRRQHGVRMSDIEKIINEYHGS